MLGTGMKGWSGFTYYHGNVVSEGIGYGERTEVQPIGQLKLVVSHALLVDEPGKGVESHMETGVADFDLNKYAQDSKCNLYFRKPRGWTPQMGERISARAHMRPPHGCKYDKSLIAADAFCDTITGRWLNKVTRGKFKRMVCWLFWVRGTFICSQMNCYVYRGIEELKYLGCMREPEDTVDPQRLFQDERLYEPGVYDRHGNLMLETVTAPIGQIHSSNVTFAPAKEHALSLIPGGKGL
jgi:hypothetical protein